MYSYPYGQTVATGTTYPPLTPPRGNTKKALLGGDPEKDLILVKSGRNGLIEEDDIIARMNSDVALTSLPSVYYRSGQLLDMARITREAHGRKILAGFDLCHSIGVIPHFLDNWDVDFAYWCSYKYMNAGPGSTGGLYVNRRLDRKSVV